MLFTCPFESTSEYRSDTSQPRASSPGNANANRSKPVRNTSSSNGNPAATSAGTRVKDRDARFTYNHNDDPAANNSSPRKIRKSLYPRNPEIPDDHVSTLTTSSKRTAPKNSSATLFNTHDSPRRPSKSVPASNEFACRIAASCNNLITPESDTTPSRSTSP